MKNNWFTTLMAANDSHPEAAYKLLVSEAAPPLDVNAVIGGRTMIGWLERQLSPTPYYWANLALKDERRYYKTRWAVPGTPLPLGPDQPQSDTISFPDSPREDKRPRFDDREAIFAKLLERGADPWIPWESKNGMVDGFDLAIATGCIPLVDACLRHPSKPDISQLRGRTPWNLLSGQDYYGKQGKARGLMSSKDTLVHALSASGQAELLSLLLENGWEAEPTGVKRTPLAMAQTPEVVGALLDAGAQLDEHIIEQWEQWATKFGAHKASLAARMKVISSRDLGGHDELMGKQVIDAFKKKDWVRLNDILAVKVKGKEKNKVSPVERARALADLEPYSTQTKKVGTKGATPFLLMLLHALGRSSKEHKTRAMLICSELAYDNPDRKIWGQISANGAALVMHQTWLATRRQGVSYSFSQWHKEVRSADKGLLVRQASQAANELFEIGNQAVRENVINSMRTMARELINEHGIEPLMEGVEFFSKTGFDPYDFTYVSEWLVDQSIDEHLSWGPTLVRSNIGKKVLGQNYWVGEMNKFLWELSLHLDRAIENGEMTETSYRRLEDLVGCFDREKFTGNGYPELASVFKNRLLAKISRHNEMGEVKTFPPPKM